MLKKLCNLKVIAGLIIAVLLAALLLFSWHYNDSTKIEQEKEAYEGASEGQYSQIIAEKNELEQKISDCEYKLNYGAMGPVVVMFSEPNKALLEAGIEAVSSIHAKAVLAVSEKNFPGDKGCLTMEETKSCIDGGWELAITATAETDIKDLNQRLNDAGLTAAAIYYPEETASAGSTDAAPLGIRYIIRYGKNVNGFIAYGIDSPEFNQDMLKEGDCLVAVIDFHEEEEKTDNVSDWLTRLENTAKEEHFLIENITEAAETVADNQKFIKENRSQLKRDLKEYKEELRKLEKKTDEMKKEYE